ncbi:Lysophospholipid acyltransferase [Coemansia sp. RSA 1813]|nr:Lysophospholipid acyltransferase [Coemansia sp. RSA 1646]KAJ1771004.1 Lysophospholipid acyltransferase [Coemansia sp. RSA 1843]KAJ2089244.1 Lysophospholipid acyltransferase [Coemansia sp. RSA 986]KAJ2215073.1 Lysophospholipid acyltransferase [Coemansia sp. RSA 487]KAJ2569014.1 Lysophospholipid acyltransferase [Coemansia sp. RSA 1813]
MEILNKGLLWISTHYLGGIPVDRIATVVAVLLSYALAHVYRRVPVAGNGKYKHLYSIASSVVLFGLIQDQCWGLVHLFGGALVVYALMVALRGRAMVAAVFLVAMLHMSYSQIRRQMAEATATENGGYVAFDHTGAQMVFVIKVTSLAWCIDDGRQPSAQLSAYQRKNAIAKMPTLLEFFGYVFFFPGLAVGPAFELATYRRMVHLDNIGAMRTQTLRAYRKLAEGFFWMAVYVVYGGRLTMPFMATDKFVATHPGYVSRVLYLCAAGVVTRAAYYTAWKMSEGACIVAGLGFDGSADRDAGRGADGGQAQWMDIANVHVRGVEVGTSLKQLIDGWNIGTNTWLRHHVYLRILQLRPKRGAAAATVITFLVSAWWHGFYPGYYLTFVLGAIASNAARTLRRSLNPLVALGPDTETPASARKRAVKRMYDVAGWALSKYTLDFTTTPFMALSLLASLRAWSSQYFAVPVGVLAVNVIFNVMGVGRLLRNRSHAKLS